MISFEFLVTSLIVVLIPGTGVIFTISMALAQGKRGGIYAAIGCTLGIVPHLLATILGLAALLHTSALAFELLKYAGVLYLFYLAVTMARSQEGFALKESDAQSSIFSIVSKALLLNFLNPKLTLFFFAFLPQFIAPTAATSALEELLVLSAIFMLMTLAVFLLYGRLAYLFRQSVIESARVQAWLKRNFAAAFAGMGVQLALSER